MRLGEFAEAPRPRTAAQGSQQTSTLLRNPILCECSLLPELEDIQEATPVVTKVGVYFAHLLRFCLVLAELLQKKLKLCHCLSNHSC